VAARLVSPDIIKPNAIVAQTVLLKTLPISPLGEVEINHGDAVGALIYQKNGEAGGSPELTLT